MEKVALRWALEKEVGAGDAWPSRQKSRRRAQIFKHLVCVGKWMYRKSSEWWEVKLGI